MRKPRGPRDEDKSDAVMDKLMEAIATLDRTRLAKPGMTQAKLDAEKARNSAKWQRRIDKAVARWERMTVLEQKAWADEYYREARRQRPSAKPAPAAELPLLFAISDLAGRDRAKAREAREAEKVAEVDPYADHREAAGANPATPRATRPPAATDPPPAAPTEPPTPERPPIFDEDDFE